MQKSFQTSGLEAFHQFFERADATMVTITWIVPCSVWKPLVVFCKNKWCIWQTRKVEIDTSVALISIIMLGRDFADCAFSETTSVQCILHLYQTFRVTNLEIPQTTIPTTLVTTSFSQMIIIPLDSELNIPICSVDLGNKNIYNCLQSLIVCQLLWNSWD